MKGVVGKGGWRGWYKGYMWLCLIMLQLGRAVWRLQGVRVPTTGSGGHNIGMGACKREALPCHYPTATNEGFMGL